MDAREFFVSLSRYPLKFIKMQIDILKTKENYDYLLWVE